MVKKKVHENRCQNIGKKIMNQTMSKKYYKNN